MSLTIFGNLECLLGNIVIAFGNTKFWTGFNEPMAEKLENFNDSKYVDPTAKYTRDAPMSASFSPILQFYYYSI